MPTKEDIALFARLKSGKRLPSPAGTALKVLELCRDDDSGLREISDVISSDPALAARLLKFANSAATGLDREVISVREAVLLMGVRSVKLAALGFSLALPDSKSACSGFDLRAYWSEACAAAVIARALAKERFKTEPEEAFTAGLLAKIGRLALAQGMPGEYADVLEEIRMGKTLEEAERMILGSDHAQVGAALLKDWSLPRDLVEGVRCQLRPSVAQGKGATLARVIATAYAMVPAIVGTPMTAQATASLRRLVGGDLGMSEAEWSKFAADSAVAHKETASALSIAVDQVAAMDLYAEAQEEATRVGMVAQIERAKASQDAEDLLRRATTDALTGVANRARFDERIEELAKGLSRGHGAFALVMLDIDHFKNLNDAHGHQAGDLVLTRVARAIQNSLRDVDLLARYGGEEFAILAPATERDGACLIAARCRKCVEALRVQVEGQTLSVTISLGVTVSGDFPAGAAGREFIAEADKQLYLSKKNGRNTFSYRGRSASQVGTPPSAANAA